MKITVIARKPRNPLVAHARFRQAGRHAGHAPRQRDARALRRELETLKASP